MAANGIDMQPGELGDAFNRQRGRGSREQLGDLGPAVSRRDLSGHRRCLSLICDLFNKTG